MMLEEDDAFCRRRGQSDNAFCRRRGQSFGEGFGEARRSERISRRDMRGTAEGEEETILQREKGEIWHCRGRRGDNSATRKG
jgi:hypothetical protein